MRASRTTWPMPSAQPLETTTEDMGQRDRSPSPLLSEKCQKSKSINGIITIDTFSYFISEEYVGISIHKLCSMRPTTDLFSIVLIRAKHLKNFLEF